MMWCLQQLEMRSIIAESVRILRHIPKKRCYSEERRPIRTVAVIGGGIAGLSCAQHLASDPNYKVTVFDKGRLRPGGRCSSRCALDKRSSKKQEKVQRGNRLLSKYTYDHGAQIVPCPTHKRHEPFRQFLDRLEENGIITSFPKDSLYELRSITKCVPINDLKYYYGTAEGGGIGGIASFMAKQSQFSVKQNVYVSPERGIKYKDEEEKWLVQGSYDRMADTIYGVYDALVIAHSGMGAHQLVGLIPNPAIADRMKVQFEPKLLKDGGSCLSLNSIYSLTFAIPAQNSVLSAALPSSFISGFVRNHPVFRFISCQTRKYGAHDENVEVWTVLSSSDFGKKHGTSLTDSVVFRKMFNKVSRMLLWAVEEFITGKKTKRPEDSLYEKKKVFPPPSALELSVLDHDLQWWPEAVPMNVYKLLHVPAPARYFYDSELNVGVCGDWLVEANIAGAWTSGRLLAEHIMNKRTKKQGYAGVFRRSLPTAKAGIGMLIMESEQASPKGKIHREDDSFDV